MTYNQTVKTINALYELLNAKTVTEIPYIGTKTICEGHGTFRNTNELCVKYFRAENPSLTGKDRAKIEKTIKTLEDSIKEEKERRANVAKAKRYKKELEELNNRKAYLEKWLAEYEG